MSSISDMISQVADLSLADKLALIDSVVASIRKEGGMPAIKKVKASKASEKVEGEKKPKRKAALGTLAWTAYVKHIKTTQPDAFEGLTKESEKLVIVKGIRAEDAEGYKTFTDAWKAERTESDAVSASEAETESVAESVVEEPVPKKAAPKAAPKVTPAVKTPETPAAAAKPAPKVTPAAKTPEKPAAAAKPAPKAVKTVKKAKAEEPSMPQKEIDGTNYWHHPKTNGLWEVTGETAENGTGAWIGYFQPGNEEEPIRFTEAFGDE